MEKNNDKIDWVHGSYAIEQSNLMDGADADQDEGGADAANKKGDEKIVDDVFIKLDI